MDSTSAILIGLLGKLEMVIRADPELTVRGLGILLLQKKFDRSTEENNEDPTFAILGRKVGGLGSDEMIPRF